MDFLQSIDFQWLSAALLALLFFLGLYLNAVKARAHAQQQAFITAQSDLEQARATALQLQQTWEAQGREDAASIASTQAQLELKLQDVLQLQTAMSELQQLPAQVAQLQAQLHGRSEQITKLETDLNATKIKLETSLSQERELQARNAALLQEHEGFEKRLSEQGVWVKEQTAAFEDRVRVVTAELLKKQVSEVDTQSRKSLDGLLNPFKSSLSEFRQQVEGFAKEQAAERENLKGRIQTLAEVHGSLASKTDALTKALTTQNKQQGDWGETQLVRLLEAAGLQEGIGYRTQVTVQSADDDSRKQRPDVVIELPENRQVIVDAKVSIAAWTQANETDDELERQQYLANHIASVRRHIDDLYKRDYSASPDIHSLDFVVMFMHVEPAYVAAASADPRLFQEAFEKGVIVAGPTMLMAILKMINSLWNIHKQEENAAKIIELGSKIHSKMASFAKSFEDIGGRLDNAQQAFQSARGQLLDGRGNAMKMLTQMETLGVSVKKTLPDTLQKDMGDAALVSEAEEAESAPN